MLQRCCPSPNRFHSFQSDRLSSKFLTKSSPNGHWPTLPTKLRPFIKLFGELAWRRLENSLQFRFLRKRITLQMAAKPAAHLPVTSPPSLYLPCFSPCPADTASSVSVTRLSPRGLSDPSSRHPSDMSRLSPGRHVPPVTRGPSSMFAHPGGSGRSGWEHSPLRPAAVIRLRHFRHEDAGTPSAAAGSCSLFLSLHVVVTDIAT